jgi:hypothetical protein
MACGERLLYIGRMPFFTVQGLQKNTNWLELRIKCRNLGLYHNQKRSGYLISEGIESSDLCYAMVLKELAASIFRVAGTVYRFPILKESVIAVAKIHCYKISYSVNNRSSSLLFPVG